MNLKEPKKQPSKLKGRGANLGEQLANKEDDSRKGFKKPQQRTQRTLKTSNSSANNTPPKSEDSSKCESLSDSLDFILGEHISPPETVASRIRKLSQESEEKENQQASPTKKKLVPNKRRKVTSAQPKENESQKTTALESLVPVHESIAVPDTIPNLAEVSNGDESPLFTVGDMAWAYMPGYPLWPAIITINNEEGIHIKSKSFGLKEKPLIHVEFFGDRGSHSWLTTQSLFPFTDDLEQFKKDHGVVNNSKAKVKVSKAKRKILASIQKAIKGERSSWQSAFEEAKQCQSLPKEKRVEFIRELVLQKVEGYRRKRKVDSQAQSSDQPRRAKRSRSTKEDTTVEESIPTPSPTPTPSLTPTPTPSEEPDVEESIPTEGNQTQHAVGNKRKRRLEKKKDPVCDQCAIRGDVPLVPCQKCRLLYHAECCGSERQETDPAALLCPHCQPNENPSCFLCKQATDVEVVRCTIKTCNRSYHLACIKSFHSSVAHGQSASSKDSNLICPAHYCHTCVADLHNVHHPHKKLIRCIKCPTAYHSSEICLGAGCVRLSLTQMICSKHVEPEAQSSGKRKNPIHVNANWCFLCSEGGRLICCERCPASFHTHCLNMDREPEGSYICYECMTGKTILYGDLVWVKIGAYRWWPARVFPPDEIPAQFHERFVEASPGEFLVQFYGSHDFAFVHRGQAFLYQEGDRGTKDRSKRTLAVRYEAALDEAQKAFQERQLALQELTAERQAQVNTKPPPYIRIRSNKAVGKARIYESHSRSSPAICECDPKQDHPCGPDSECLNRILLIECDPSCPAGARCENQRFQKRLYPQLYPFNAGGKGWGLKAQVDLKKGDFVVEYVGEVIDQEEFHNRLKAKQDAQDESYYFLTLDQTRVIDAGPRGNLARFMNHSCQPNCETQKWTVLGDTRVGLFAVEDIPAETELTFNYHLECAQDVVDESTAKTRQQPCHCGAPICSGFIGAKATKSNGKNRIAGAGDDQPNGKGAKKTKKRKANRRTVERHQAEDSCFRCTEGGRLIMCDVKTCSKVYHLECLNLTTTPKGKWECPWHHCDVCGRRASVFCSICPNSFCPAHSDASNTETHPQLGSLCNEHTQEDIDFFIRRLSGTPDEDEDQAAQDQDQ